MIKIFLSGVDQIAHLEAIQTGRVEPCYLEVVAQGILLVVDLALVGSRLAAEVELVRKTAVEEHILVVGPILGNLDFVRME